MMAATTISSAANDWTGWLRHSGLGGREGLEYAREPDALFVGLGEGAAARVAQAAAVAWDTSFSGRAIKRWPSFKSAKRS